ncbi:hypothetical protein B0H17DRAFT_1336105 [Mycena rosella]|uniref:Uncharacterized protein n=1 Tax=Mycena rosella TaxID=1033263 RepID=A0AAD7CWF4_MYCRO|nr:hypothetical protein B0H17DRAFT_1336105 [Mycena rosella]
MRRRGQRVCARRTVRAPERGAERTPYPRPAPRTPRSTPTSAPHPPRPHPSPTVAPRAVLLRRPCVSLPLRTPSRTPSHTRGHERHQHQRPHPAIASQFTPADATDTVHIPRRRNASSTPLTTCTARTPRPHPAPCLLRTCLLRISASASRTRPPLAALTLHTSRTPPAATPSTPASRAHSPNMSSRREHDLDGSASYQSRGEAKRMRTVCFLHRLCAAFLQRARPASRVPQIRKYAAGSEAPIPTRGGQRTPTRGGQRTPLRGD